MNEKKLVSQAMSVLGSRTSERKAEAARNNGKSGGRPRLHKGNTHDRRKARRSSNQPFSPPSTSKE